MGEHNPQRESFTPRATTAAILLQCPQPHTLHLVSGPFPAVHQENNPEIWLSSKSNPLLQPLPAHAVPLPHAAHLCSPGPSWTQGSSLTQQKVNKAQNSTSFCAGLVFCWINGLEQCTKEPGDYQSQGTDRSVQKDTPAVETLLRIGLANFREFGVCLGFF